MSSKPPTCPNCGKELTHVNFVETAPPKYVWKEGGYNEEDPGQAETRCPDCDADLSDLFPEGPVNY